MASKKIKQRKPAKKTNARSKNTTSTSLPSFLTNDQFFMAATLVVAAIYYTFSFYSTGFHHHDGAGHYLTMRDLMFKLKDGITHKSAGFMFFYAIPAQFGLVGVKIWGSLIAATSCFLVYKITKRINKNVAFLAFIFLATQHWWVNFSFRTHVEVATAFVFILAAFLHQREKYLLAGIVFSIIGSFRPVLYVVGFGYFLYLFFLKKKYIEALAMGTIPLLINILGWYYLDDPLALLSMLTGGPGAGTWEKAGFDHYFQRFGEIFGGLVTALAVAFLASWFFTKEKRDKYMFIFLPPAVFFFIHCLINFETIHIGPYVGGTSRYMIVIGPYLAVMAALATALVEKVDPKYKLLLFLVPVLVLTGFFLSYEIEHQIYYDQKKWDSTIFIALATLLIMVPTTILSLKHKYFIYAGFAILSAFQSVKPYVIDYELAVVKEVAAWYKENYMNNGRQTQLYNNHQMFYYFLGESSLEIKPKPLNILNDEQMKTAPKGSIIMWESHYGYRPTKANYELQYTYFTERPQEYKLIKQSVSPNQRFVSLFFEKLK